MLFLRRLSFRAVRATRLATSAAVVLATQVGTCQAALPGAQSPTRGEGSSYFEAFKNYLYDGFMLAGMGLCAFCLILVVRHCMTVFHEIHVGKKTWPDLFATAAVGVGLACLTIFFATKATGIW